MQFRTSHKIILAVLLTVSVGLLSIAKVQGSSERFTLTETPIGDWSDIANDYERWTYVASANQAPGAFNRWQDSPWHWRHYDPTESGREHIKCDDIQYLFPADPNSVDTAVSADGQTITVNIHQAKDSVYVCFALECDDGSHSFVLMRNLETEKTIRSGPCGGAAGTSSIPTTNNDPPVVVEEEEEEEETTTTTTTTNPLVPPADPITTDPLPDDDDNNDDDNNDPPQTSTPPVTNNDPPKTDTPPTTNNDPPQTDNPTTTKTDPPPEIIPKTETSDSQDTPETDNDDNSGQIEQTDQEPVVTTNPPVVRTEQYQGSWK